ncbi:hypothetical protein SCHPADRAFT_912906 [Schizopora paradoxa]|uniref:Uncharacterized protein n=1 Tax=Schizopora paradoxa TaxID=27342 RepID=A0A0H2SPY1_9AGAM|nr:hypothetical protein SCHPADRAFT_912906 [Schizopora paradoxa]
MSENASSSSAAKTHGNSSGAAEGSRRWTYFHSALQLAIQRCAHKWTYEEFSECFELWCKEEPDGASGVYNTISRHMEHLITTACDKLFERYDAREKIDILHAVVTEARERQKAGVLPEPDTWRADIDPRTAARARTIPILTNERDELKRRLAELESENDELQSKIQSNARQIDRNEREETARIKVLRELEAQWSSLPVEDIQEWALRTAETLTTKSVP